MFGTASQTKLNNYSIESIGYNSNLKTLLTVFVTLLLCFFQGAPRAQGLEVLGETNTSIEPSKTTHPKILHWKETIADTLSDEALHTQSKLQLTNHYWNSLRQVNDIELYGREDVWATPEETLTLGAGDCEDLAIGKYFTLISAGIDENQLMLGHVKLTGYGGHMVLIFIDNDKNRWVLDNMNSTIARLEERKDLTLVYTLNKQELRFSNMAHVKANPFTVAHWKGLVERLKSGA